MKKHNNEIDEGQGYTGFREALDIIETAVRPAGDETIPLDVCVNRIASCDLKATVSNPSGDVSLKDGFAVRSTDIVNASADMPVRLVVAGSSFAGAGFNGQLEHGMAVRICSGASIPDGADAVVAAEFCDCTADGGIFVMADAGPGRNVMFRDEEVKAGEIIVRKGERFFPGVIGLAAAAGISTAKVCLRPRIAIVSTGDEIVVPGEELHAGQLYASNMITMKSWLGYYGFPCSASVVPDDQSVIMDELQKHMTGIDAIVTSGGALGSERDLVVGSLDRLGWKKLFHMVRMGPGKGVAFGLLDDVPVFCLPGGPTSNSIAFLQLALPALFRMAGETGHPLQTVHARLLENVQGRHHAWTEFRDAVVSLDEYGNYTAALYKTGSRLKAIARADGLICIPEGKEYLRRESIVPVQLLRPLPECQ